MALTIGVLGAARITPSALIRPAREVDGVTVDAVAARDRNRADAFARKHGIPRVLDSYEAVIEDPGLDAVYIPLPNGLHAQWTARAVAAGKHVLCEKPFTANAAEAEAIASTATGDPVVMEAFHYRYHPLAERVLAIVRDELGPVRRIETNMCFPLPRFRDIRYSYDLAGGALMDAGCYAIHFLRLLGEGNGERDGEGEPEVTSATALRLRRDPRVDRAMAVHVRFPGATGRARASMWSSTLLNVSATVVGEHGWVRVLNFAAPQYFHRLTVSVRGEKRTERVAGEASYTHQLRAFAAAVNGEPTNLTPPADSVATMRVIDAAYRAAGLPRRGETDTRSG